MPDLTVLTALTAGSLLGIAACGDSSADCADPTCGSGASMTVALEDVGTTYAEELPLSIKLCVEATCTTFSIKSTGQVGMLECENLTGGDEVCTIDGMGTVVVSALPLPDGVAPGASVMVSATVTPKSGSAFSGMQSVTVTGTSSCGGCTSGGAAFSP